MRNITVTNNILTATKDIGLMIYNWYDSYIANNVITGKTSGGNKAAKSSNKNPYNILMENNTINAVQTGIRISGSAERRIYGVTIQNNTVNVTGKRTKDHLIYANYTDKQKGKGVVIKNNVFSGGRAKTPVSIETCNGLTFSGSTIKLNYSGVSNVVLVQKKSKNCAVRDNLIRANNKNKEHGITVSASSGTKVTGNTIEKAKKYGVRVLGGSTKTIISNNKIVKCKRGGIGLSGSKKNTVSKNKFSGIAKKNRIVK